MNLKYTRDQETELTEEYKAFHPDDHDGRETYILKFMAKHDKTKRSVTAKLSKLGIYIARPKVSKVTGEKAVTKEQMVNTVALKLGMDVGQLEGLDKAPKLTLQNLLKRLEE